MKTSSLILLQCCILLSVHTGLTWEQQGAPCQYATSMNTGDILAVDLSRSSLLHTQTYGYPLAEQKKFPMLWSLHHLNNEPGLNTGLQMPSSKEMGQGPRDDLQGFLPPLASGFSGTHGVLVKGVNGKHFCGSGGGEVASSDKRIKAILIIEGKNPVRMYSQKVIDSHSWIGLETLENTVGEVINNNISIEIRSALNVKLWDRSTTFDHQNIVILEDDPVVMESAYFLFKKQTSVSTLMRYHKGALQVIRGSQTSLTKNSRVVLVGHGSKKSNGVVRLGGYGPDKLAKVVASMEIEDGHLFTLSLVGCALGKDLEFTERLLRVLRALNVETELHLSTSELSISPNGEMLTREDGVWRQKDTSKKVIAQLDQNSNLMTRVEGVERGQVIPHYMGHGLQKDCPEKPALFVDNNKKSEITCCLNAIAWAIFGTDNQNIPTQKRFQLAEEKAGNEEGGKANTKTKPKKADEKTSNNVKYATEITTIDTLINEIRKKACNSQQIDYYILNNHLYEVNEVIYVSYLGSFKENSDQIETVRNKQYLSGLQTYAEIRHDIQINLYEFIKLTFYAQYIQMDKIERIGLYFMAAVFAESVRNFRTFPLFLMTVIKPKSSEMSWNTNGKMFLEHHPMATGGTWYNKPRKGYYGCSTPNVKPQPSFIHNKGRSSNTRAEASAKSMKEDNTNNLDRVINAESNLFEKLTQNIDISQLIQDIPLTQEHLNKYTEYIKYLKEEHSMDINQSCLRNTAEIS